MMLKVSIYQEAIRILNVYTTKNRAAKYVKLKSKTTEWRTDKSGIKVGNFNTSLSTIHRTTRQKISKE